MNRVQSAFVFDCSTKVDPDNLITPSGRSEIVGVV